MNRLAPVPSDAIQRGADFFVPPALNNPTGGDPRYLLPGETEWWGPYPVSGEHAAHFRWDLHSMVHFADTLRRSDVHLQVLSAGRYIRIRRLVHGPAHKLSDWKQLPADTPLLVHPNPSPDDVERATTRVKYMRDKGFGRYRHWADAAGALWVTRE